MKSAKNVSRRVCSTAKTETFYMIDRSRGLPALAEFFREFYDGVLLRECLSPKMAAGTEAKRSERNDRIASPGDFTVFAACGKWKTVRRCLSGRSASLREAPVPAAMSR
jgi:hypothetical protein